MRADAALVLAAVVLLAACVTEEKGNLPKPTPPNFHEAARLNTELGLEFAKQGMYEQATEKLKRAVSQDSDYGPAYAALAFVYAQRNEPEAAEPAYRRALELDPNAGTRNNFGVFLCSHGKVEEAMRNFQAALADHSYSTPEAAYSNAGVCALHAKMDAVAETNLRNALQVNPDMPDALLGMAELRYEQQRFADARPYIERYERVSKPTPQELLLANRIAQGAGDADTARRYANQLIQQFPDSNETAQLTSSSRHD